MTVQLPNPQTDSMLRRRRYLAYLLILVVSFFVLNRDQIFGRGETDFVVLEAGIPEYCYSSQTVLRIGSQRSSLPDWPQLGYCGAIQTDHGAFQVIEDGMIILGSQSRSDIVRKIRPGCAYQAQFIGLGTTPKRGDTMWVHVQPIIYAVTETSPCK